MSDDRATPPPPAQFPPMGFPTIYADDVGNLSKAESVVKFYFVRNDPTFSGMSLAAQRTPILQAVMPIEGFVRTVLFFEEAMKTMLSEKLITQETIDAIRANARVVGEG